MHPSPVPKSKAIAAKKQALPRDFLADRQRADLRLRCQCPRLHALEPRSCEYVKWIANGADPITALNAFDRLDPVIVKYLGRIGWTSRRTPMSEFRTIRTDKSMADLEAMLRCGKLQHLHEHSSLLKVEARAALFNEIAADACKHQPQTTRRAN
jgi:hypothetical protein